MNPPITHAPGTVGTRREKEKKPRGLFHLSTTRFFLSLLISSPLLAASKGDNDADDDDDADADDDDDDDADDADDDDNDAVAAPSLPIDVKRNEVSRR